MARKEEKKNQTPETEETVKEPQQEAAPEESAQEEATQEEAPQEAQENPEEAEESTQPEEETQKSDPKDEKIRELSDRLMRQMAEFENFRRRTEKEKSMMFETGASSVIEKILPVVDNFERAMATVSDEQKEDPFVSGMDKIYRQLLTVLEQLQVTPIEALGQEFDPQLHNAVMHVEDEAYGENEVIEEFQKGYKYRDSVVRHSMVKVAN